MQVLYTAAATASGGREGLVRSSDELDPPLAMPKELGGSGRVAMPGVERSKADALVKAAHEEISPYSRATRGNIEVTLELG